MTIGVKCDTTVARLRGWCTEIRRLPVSAPPATVLVAISCVPGNKEAGVERVITDQQLVGVTCACSAHTVPQSISTSILPIVISGRDGLVRSPLEVGFASSLVINKHNFRKLKNNSNNIWWEKSRLATERKRIIQNFLTVLTVASTPIDLKRFISFFVFTSMYCLKHTYNLFHESNKAIALYSWWQ